jgi:hypothetical protein
MGEHEDGLVKDHPGPEGGGAALQTKGPQVPLIRVLFIITKNMCLGRKHISVVFLIFFLKKNHRLSIFLCTG